MPHDLILINELDDALEDIRKLLHSVTRGLIEPTGSHFATELALDIVVHSQKRLQKVLS